MSSSALVRLFLGNVHQDAKPSTIAQFLGLCKGNCPAQVELVTDHTTGTCKGFGFVQVPKWKQTDVLAYNNKKFLGKPIIVEPSTSEQIAVVKREPEYIDLTKDDPPPVKVKREITTPQGHVPPKEVKREPAKASLNQPKPASVQQTTGAVKQERVTPITKHPQTQVKELCPVDLEGLKFKQEKLSRQSSFRETQSSNAAASNKPTVLTSDGTHKSPAKSQDKPVKELCPVDLEGLKFKQEKLSRESSFRETQSSNAAASNKPSVLTSDGTHKSPAKSQDKPVKAHEPKLTGVASKLQSTTAKLKDLNVSASEDWDSEIQEKRTVTVQPRANVQQKADVQEKRTVTLHTKLPSTGKTDKGSGDKASSSQNSAPPSGLDSSKALGDADKRQTKTRSMFEPTSVVPSVRDENHNAYQLIDCAAILTHTKFSADIDDVVMKAKYAGVQKIVIPSMNLRSCERAKSLAEQYPGFIYFLTGVHPHEGNTWRANSANIMRNYLKHPGCVGIGEVGLDFNRNFTNRGTQIDVFEEQLKIACDLQKPLLIHERDSHEDFVKIISKYERKLPKLVVHCFTGRRVHALKYIDMGFYIGITGHIAKDAGSDSLRQMLIQNELPWDKVLLETDAPFMYPLKIEGFVSEHGQHYHSFTCHSRNEPCALPSILEIAATLSKTDPWIISQASTANASRFFNI